ncbi:hypothetical protein BOSEA31B_10902 [Hyphomicrobiales bacterium]|nr:hypothetical protein BOSEA31B_10902 [Hyphomicrobiales bacterium]CAH1700754.1 hypothetical protein BOSEA1005_20453 [Hyphomicrobiales bacterium]CAI0344627.1 hypothetical protein BO1005MUT1_340044 [Hyphomicrobiales bacterium]
MTKWAVIAAAAAKHPPGQGPSDSLRNGSAASGQDSLDRH